MTRSNTSGQKAEESTGQPLAAYASDERAVKRAQWENMRLAACPGAGKVNVCNVSYGVAAKPEHTYTVTIENGMPVACTCPAFEHREGLCKHCLAVAADEEVLAEATPEPTPPTAVADGGAVAAADSQTATDDRDTCLFCHRRTGLTPHTVHVRRPAGPNAGKIVAKGHICEDCLGDDDRDWQYNELEGSGL